MKPQSHSLACKAIICLSIFLGAFIAFMLFKTTQQKPTPSGSTAQETQQEATSDAAHQNNSQMMMPTYEELQKMSAEIDAWHANMTQEQRVDTIGWGLQPDKVIAFWASLTPEERQNRFGSFVVPGVNEYIKEYLRKTGQDDQTVDEYLNNYLKNTGQPKEANKQVSRVDSPKKITSQNPTATVLPKKDRLSEEERKGLKAWQEVRWNLREPTGRCTACEEHAKQYRKDHPELFKDDQELAEQTKSPKQKSKQVTNSAELTL